MYERRMLVAARASPEVAAQAWRRCRQSGGSPRPAFRLHPAAAEPWRSAKTTNAFERLYEERYGSRPRPCAIGRHRSHAVLGAARFRSDQYAQVDGCQTVAAHRERTELRGFGHYILSSPGSMLPPPGANCA